MAALNTWAGRADNAAHKTGIAAIVQTINCTLPGQCGICDGWGHKEKKCSTKLRIDAIAKHTGGMAKVAWGSYKAEKMWEGKKKRARDIEDDIACEADGGERKRVKRDNAGVLQVWARV
jgi:hypothetical protein